MRNILIFTLLLLMLSGCQAPAVAPVESASPKAPAQTATATPRDIGAEAVEIVKTWKTPDQAWGKLHPQLLEKIQERDKKRILLGFRTGLGMCGKSSGEIELQPTTARQTQRYYYPVLPTHDVVVGESSFPVFHVKIDDTGWHLTPSLTTEAALLAAADPQSTPEEKKALALKVLEELSPEQIAMLNEKIQSGSKIQAVKALREIEPHGLAIHKLAIEILMERQKN